MTKKSPFTMIPVVLFLLSCTTAHAQTAVHGLVVLIDFSDQPATIPVGVVGERLKQDFQRDLAVQLRILRAVDLTHSAGTERADDFIWTETGTWSERQFGQDCMTVRATGFLPCFPQLLVPIIRSSGSDHQSDADTFEQTIGASL